MGFFDRVKNLFRAETENAAYKLKMVRETTNGIYSWNGRMYQSDIIRSAIRPFVKSIGKLEPKHVREGPTGLKVNPEPWLRMLLDDPNPYMSGQMLLEKVAVQFELNKNAFVLIVRDAFGYPYQLYPVPAINVESVHDQSGNIFLKFGLSNGKTMTAAYSDVIHIRDDFNENDIFGTHPGDAISSLMEVVSTTDQSVVNAIKNSAIIKWIMMFKTVLQPSDVKTSIKEFTDNYLKIAEDTETVGVAAADPRYELKQVDHKDYVPGVELVKEATRRVFAFFNTNENIIHSNANGDQWNTYYEMKIEPVAIQLSKEFTRKLFTRKERGFGNQIIFEASSLQYMSFDQKMQLVQAIDRGLMSVNEWRKAMNMAPAPDGDVYMRRLDTAVIDNGGVTNDQNQE